MIALLLAAQVVAAAPSIQLPEIPLVATPRVAATAQTVIPPRIIYTGRRLRTAACNAPVRYQTSYPEPALLLRPQDERARDGVKRLIDMPMGRFCLTGGSGDGGR